MQGFIDIYIRFIKAFQISNKLEPVKKNLFPPSYVKLKLTRQGKKMTRRIKRDPKNRINKTVSIRIRSRKYS